MLGRCMGRFAPGNDNVRRPFARRLVYGREIGVHCRVIAGAARTALACRRYFHVVIRGKKLR
jgi:hypothetical protein